MNLPTSFVLLALVLATIVIAAAIFHLMKNGNLLTITLFSKSYAFSLPLREENSYAIAAPLIRPVNDFLADFANSPEKRVEFTSDDIKSSSPAQPLLRALQGMDYEKIRLRLRVISSLNPIVNLETEEGIIQFTCGLSSGVPQHVKLRSQFAPKGQSILLEKL